MSEPRICEKLCPFMHGYRQCLVRRHKPQETSPGKPCPRDDERRAALLEQYGDPDLALKYEAAITEIYERCSRPERENDCQYMEGPNLYHCHDCQEEIARRVEEMKAERETTP